MPAVRNAAVTPSNLWRNLFRNFVSTLVAFEIARRNMPRDRKLSQHFCQPEALHEVEWRSTFRNDCRNVATQLIETSCLKIDPTSTEIARQIARNVGNNSVFSLWRILIIIVTLTNVLFVMF